MRAPARQRGRRGTATTLSARLGGHVTLGVQSSGEIVASFNGLSIGLGKFSVGAAERAQKLGEGLPLASFGSGGGTVDKEIDLLVRRLARRGLLEYRLKRARSPENLVVIEPQVPGYWPQTPELSDADSLVLSRFAYIRRRGNEMVLELPRAGALFKIDDPKVAAALVLLSTPQQIKRLRRQGGFPGLELLALLVDCQILFKVDASRRKRRSAVG